jgi:DNA primase
VSDFAQTVKQQADIVKVIEGYIRLRKARTLISVV